MADRLRSGSPAPVCGREPAPVRGRPPLPAHECLPSAARRRPRTRANRLLALAVLPFAAGCGGDDAAARTEAVRDTLPDGTVHVRYGSLPEADGMLEADLRLGVLEGRDEEVFGDVRAVEAAPGGEVFVLDAQASEVRVFDAEGTYLRTIGGSGEGPGEISSANGMLLDAEGTLWVNDHGKWQMLRLAPDGEEMERVPMHILSYGYLWDGVLDDRGRLWRTANHSDQARPASTELEEGPLEGISRVYLKSLDLASGVVDSIYVGERAYRSYVIQGDGVTSFRGIPFDPQPSVAVDPGGGFWLTDGQAYRIIRLDASGDTALVIEADVAPEPVTSDDRGSYASQEVESAPEARRAAEGIARAMGDTKPLLDQMVVDDEGRLWVRRASYDEEPPIYDVFSRDGGHLASLRFGFQPAPHFPPRIRQGRLYILEMDSLDVPRVARVRIPDLPQ